MYDRSLGDGSVDLTKLTSLNTNSSHIYKILLYILIGILPKY